MNTYNKIRTALPRCLAAMIAALAMAACSSEEDLVIPVEPSYTDAQEDLAAFRQQLLSSANGWEGLLSPQPGKTYRVFLELTTEGVVSLYTDADTMAAHTPTATRYQVKLFQSVNPTLYFEPGSNLERIPASDRNPGVDKAYNYRFTTGDTLHLLGNQYGDELLLVKATRANRERYINKDLKIPVKNIAAYLATVRYLYAQPAPGKLVQFMSNPLSRNMYITYLDNGARFFGSDYAHSLDGLLMKNGLHTNALDVQEIGWDDARRVLYIYYNGVRLDLHESPIPVIPLHYLLGSEYPPGAVFPTPYSGTLPGWSEKFQTLWLTDDDNLWKDFRISLYYVVTNLHVDEHTMDLYVYYLNTDDDYVRGKFPYTFNKTDDGVYTFTPLPIDDSEEGDHARAIADHLPNILGVMNGNRFRIEFFDAYEEFNGVIPQYISVDDPDLHFTGFFFYE